MSYHQHHPAKAVYGHGCHSVNSVSGDWVRPDFVQVYAVDYGETTPGGLGDIANIVDLSIPESGYVSTITVLAGAIYTIWLCGRTGTKDNPDDQIDGDYWENRCVGQTVVTQAFPVPAAQRQPLIISSVDRGAGHDFQS